jgi:hypothetical protein
MVVGGRRRAHVEGLSFVLGGCNRPGRDCQADHTTDWQHGGLTDVDNGKPECGHHNRLQSLGFRVLRDDNGHWHTYRPDGTEI